MESHSDIITWCIRTETITALLSLEGFRAPPDEKIIRIS